MCWASYANRKLHLGYRVARLLLDRRETTH
jgi:hypothetical protein